MVIIFLCLRNYQLRLRLRRYNSYKKNKIEHYQVHPGVVAGGFNTIVNESFMGGGWMATSGNLDNPPKPILDTNQKQNQNQVGNLLILGLFFGLVYGFYFWINHKKK